MALSFSDAKNISIVEYLRTLGCEPNKIRGYDHWYHSPFRLEKDPSFKVNSKLNVWYDHGIGEGGTLLDLGAKLHQCSIHEFMKKLSHSSFLQHDFSLHRKHSDGVSNKLEIISITSLSDERLLNYLTKRAIDENIAKEYCKEVNFQIVAKSYKAIGFGNRSGGYELRNEWFKGTASPKDISLIDNRSEKVCVQEGFIDFLSIIQLDDKPIKHLTENSNFIILNSLSFLGKILPLLKSYSERVLFLDNDLAGKNAKVDLLSKGISFHDGSTIYSSFKDVNEFLVSKRVARLASARSRGLPL